MRVCHRTHQGLVRASNQDSLLAEGRLYGVADGMGGHKGGETASRVAVQVQQSPPWEPFFTAGMCFWCWRVDYPGFSPHQRKRHKVAYEKDSLRFCRPSFLCSEKGAQYRGSRTPHSGTASPKPTTRKQGGPH